MGTEEVNKAEMLQKPKQHYGLLTATTMIIGTVIGSGIFFKSDDILSDTGGNVWLGVLVFCIAAWGIVFGSLTIIELANRTDKCGGVVAYFEEFVSYKIASGFGWFQTFVYFPTLIVVIAWVAGIYTCSLFGLSSTLEVQCLIGILYIFFFYLLNLISVKAGGNFQNISTIVKLIPLLFIAIAGTLWHGAHPELVNHVINQNTKISSSSIAWLAALAPTAFSFDGWVVATNITNEVKNPRKNMTLALIIGPIIVLAIYLSFFIGMTHMLGSSYILATGNDAINQVGTMLLGQYGSGILLVFILIAVLGVVNGLILGAIRLPQALASKRMIPKADKIEKIDEKRQLSLKSWGISILTCYVWFVVHYVTQKINILGGVDISEIAIVFSYVCYMLLYIKVLQMKVKNEVKGIFRGVICPVFAIIGAAIIFIGGFISNPFYVSIFSVFCVIIFITGMIYYEKQSHKTI